MFETGVPAWEAWDAAHPEHRLVAELDGEVAGWAALSPVSDRWCYRGVAENSVYVAAWARGRGLGRLLLEELVVRSEAAGIWTLRAGIFPENRASTRLHVVCGFRLVGVHERLGQLNGVWRDVLLLERRSDAV
jgi:L-amino acid N-acyltransferase YncA